MTQIKTLLNASSQHTRISRFLSTNKDSGYFVFDAAAVIKLDMPKYYAVSDTLDQPHTASRRDRLNADPMKSAALERARRRISHEIDTRSTFALTKLRLNAGLSQAALAGLIGTQQPAIARLEKGETDPNLSTMVKLAVALKIPVEAVLAAFIDAKQIRGEK